MLLFLSGGGSSDIRRQDVTCHWGSYWRAQKAAGWTPSSSSYLSSAFEWGLISGAPASLTVFHCIVHFSKHRLLFLGFFLVLQRHSRDPEKCPRCICSGECIMEQSEPPNLRRQHHCLATKHLGTCSWSAFSWWPCEAGRAGAKGAGRQCRLHRGNSEGQVKRLECGHPLSLPFCHSDDSTNISPFTAPQLVAFTGIILYKLKVCGNPTSSVLPVPFFEQHLLTLSRFITVWQFSQYVKLFSSYYACTVICDQWPLMLLL